VRAEYDETLGRLLDDVDFARRYQGVLDSCRRRRERDCATSWPRASARSTLSSRG